MSSIDDLKGILLKQKELLSNLESGIDNLEGKDLIRENESLKVELSKLQKILDTEKVTSVKIKEENKKLRSALYEHVYSEKLQLLNYTQKQIDIYFKSNINEEVNKLRNFETNSRQYINKMIESLKVSRVEAGDDVYESLKELQQIVDKRVAIARQEQTKQALEFNRNRIEEFKKLKGEELTEEQLKESIKKNNIESLVGLNIINKVGVFLLIIGVIALGQLTYVRLTDLLKGIFAFAIGGGLLLGGELLNRKKPNVFSLGITSGGVAVLYAALALNYFGLKTIGMYTALALCVLFTVGAFILSLRYDSQTISSFAMIGGYLPLLSIDGRMTLVYGAMVYFIILNLLAVIISMNKKWIATSFIGFGLNVLGSLYIMSITLDWNNGDFSTEGLITIIYLIFTFISYTIVPIASTYKNKLKFDISDTFLLALNTVISTLFLYLSFFGTGLSDFKGLLAVIFAVIYIALGNFIENHMWAEERTKILFYITGLTFVILIVPFQFDKAWLSMGWLVEGVALLSYGIYKEDRGLKISGMVISGLCLGMFLLIDVTSYLTFNMIGDYNNLFPYKYFAITLGSIIILAFLILKEDLKQEAASYFKYGVVINIWIFLMYIIGDRINDYLTQSLKNSSFNSDYLIFALMIVTSFILAYIMPKIELIYDRAIRFISIVINSITLLSLLYLNPITPVKDGFGKAPASISFMGTILIIGITLFGIFALREVVLSLVVDGNFTAEWYPIIVSSYFIIVLTQNLIYQYNLEFTNAAISIIYVIIALALIIFGFIKRYALIRRFGLGLSILSVAKLFIIDLSFLSQGYKIVSYFVFGVTLIAISFAYQYFNKRIEIIGEVMPHDKKIDS